MKQLIIVDMGYGPRECWEVVEVVATTNQQHLVQRAGGERVWVDFWEPTGRDYMKLASDVCDEIQRGTKDVRIVCFNRFNGKNIVLPEIFEECERRGRAPQWNQKRDTLMFGHFNQFVRICNPGRELKTPALFYEHYTLKPKED